jgi:hypothetical protein
MKNYFFVKYLQIRSVFIIFVFIIFVASCSVGKSNDINANSDQNNVNSEIKIYEIPGQEEIKKNNSLISLQITNLSDNNIVFPNDYGLRLFVLNGDIWKEVNNCYHYAETERDLPSVNGPQIGLVFDIFPCVDEINKTKTLRVWVIGTKQDETGEKVMAFIDLILKP